ncbi:MAG TPA: dsRBD fold-containing protein [Acidimicrobiales bacterium]|jgi:Domain of unknown function (DUF1876)/Domain of unknown function (DUF1918)|nr:dsRBD fold-containing protein [Acidimicrobiales bacterium]
MEAHVGDHVVVEGAKVGQARRQGQVLEILHGAGGPRLRVRWDDDHESVIAPGADLRIETGEGGGVVGRLTLRVDVTLTEDADHCEAVAHVRVREREFSGWGRARRNPADPEMPVVGEELAVARALSEVSHQLVVAAADSLESALGRPIALHV